MPNARRRRKKQAKKVKNEVERSVTPTLVTNSRGESVPGFFGGGFIDAFNNAASYYGGGNFSPYQGIQADQSSDLRNFALVAEGAGFNLSDPNQLGAAQDFWNAMSPSEQRDAIQAARLGAPLGGAGDDGGSGASSALGYAQLGLEQEMFAWQQEMDQIDAELAQAQFELDQQLGLGQLQLAQQTEARIRNLEGRRVTVEERLANLEFRRFEDEQRQAIAQQNIWLGQRGQDITQRGQDISAQLDLLSMGLQQDRDLRDDLLARGEFEQANAIEERIRLTESLGMQLQQRAQDIGMRDTDVNAIGRFNEQMLQNADSLRNFAIQSGDLQLQADAEDRMRAAQQQNVALAHMDAQIRAGRFGIDAASAAAQQFGNLAGIEQERSSELARLMANPRDWVQLQIAQGGGRSFLEDILSGRAPGAQGANLVGDQQTLGAGFGQILDSFTNNPAFDMAMQSAQRLAELGEQAPQAPDLDFLLGMGATGPAFRDFGGPAQFDPMSPFLPQPWGIDIQGQFDQLGPMPQLGAPPTPTDLGSFQLPEQVSKLGPESVLNPAEAATYAEFREAAPDVPIDRAIAIAKNPDAFRNMAGGGSQPPALPPPPPQLPQHAAQQGQTVDTRNQLQQIAQGGGGDPRDVLLQMQRDAGLIPAAAQGADLVVNEPTVAVGLHSGEPQFTFSEAGPERIEITPMKKQKRRFQTGGKVDTEPARSIFGSVQQRQEQQYGPTMPTQTGAPPTTGPKPIQAAPPGTPINRPPINPVQPYVPQQGMVKPTGPSDVGMQDIGGPGFYDINKPRVGPGTNQMPIGAPGAPQPGSPSPTGGYSYQTGALGSPWYNVPPTGPGMRPASAPDYGPRPGMPGGAPPGYSMWLGMRNAPPGSQQPQIYFSPEQQQQFQSYYNATSGGAPHPDIYRGPPAPNPYGGPRPGAPSPWMPTGGFNPYGGYPSFPRPTFGNVNPYGGYGMQPQPYFSRPQPYQPRPYSPWDQLSAMTQPGPQPSQPRPVDTGRLDIVGADRPGANLAPALSMPSFNPSFGTGQRPQLTPFRPPMPTSVGTDFFRPGGTLLNMMRGLTPRSFMNMLPSQRAMTGGLASALGMPEEDFFASLQRGYPTGPNPATTFFGSNF